MSKTSSSVYSMRWLLAVACAMLCCASLFADTDRKKAEYIYLEASEALRDQRTDDYYMLLKRAAELDPEDPFIAGAYAEAELRLSKTEPDSATLARIYSALYRRILADPYTESYLLPYRAIAHVHKKVDDEVALWEMIRSLQADRTDPTVNLVNALLARYNSRPDTADYRRAMALLDSLEAKLDPNMQLTGLRLTALMSGPESKDSTQMEASLSRLYKFAPRDVANNIFLAQAYTAINQPDKAIRYLDNALELEPENGRVHIARADFFDAIGDSTNYYREVSNTLRAADLEFEYKYQLLKDYVVALYADSAQTERIEKLFDVLQEVNPGESELHSFYGAYLMQTNNFPRAAEQLSYSLDLQPDNLSNWAMLMDAQMRSDKHEQAVETGRKALQYFPGEPHVSTQAAAILLSNGKAQEALLTLNGADLSQYTKDESKAVFYATRGDILSALNFPDSAFAAYDEAIALDPENYMAMNNCAYFMAVNNKELDRAELYASLAANSEPDNSTFLDTYAWVKFKKGLYQEARELIDRALKADEASELPSAEILEHAGDIYFLDGQKSQAVDLWKKALKLDPDNKTLRLKVKLKKYISE